MSLKTKINLVLLEQGIFLHEDLMGLYSFGNGDWRLYLRSEKVKTIESDLHIFNIKWYYKNPTPRKKELTITSKDNNLINFISNERK